MRHLLTALILVALVCPLELASADLPEVMSYQGVLKDGAGIPVPDGTYEITFSLYDVAVGGTALWTETQTLPVTDAIINAHLGDVVPLTTLEFDVPYWLGISIEADPELTPRVRLTTVPYAVRASTAYYCEQADPDGDWTIDGDDIYRMIGNVGIGTTSPDWALDIHRETEGTNYMSITNAATGSGMWNGLLMGVGGNVGWISHSAPGDLRVGRGAAVTSININPAGDVGVGTSTPQEKLDVDGTARVQGFQMPTGAADGYVLTSDASGVGTWQAGGGPIGFEDMENPFNIGSSTWYWSQTTGHFDIDHTGSNFPVMSIDNESNASDGDCLYLSSMGSEAGSSTYVLYSSTYRGKAGQFTKFTDDNQYAVQITGASTTSEGLYVRGTIVSTVPLVRSVETSRGREPVFSVEAAEPAVVASGRAGLAGGVADVAFERMFTESVTSDGDVRVTVTPIGGWSALYIESTSSEGFSVRTASGEADIDFYWTATGSAKDAVDQAAIVLPDPEEDRRIEAAKMSQLD